VSAKTPTPVPCLSGFDVYVLNALVGCKLGVLDGRRVGVSPAFYDLLKAAQTQSEIVALLKSLRVVNVGEPLHDAQWHKDTLQINLEQLAKIMHKETP
jgi:hypothetical protein